MNTRTTSIILAVVAIVILGALLWLVFGGSKEVVETPAPPEEMGYIPQIINAKHQFIDGMHTIAGEVDVPTPCDLLETASFVLVREPDVDRATVQFTTINESEVCIQVVTSARFKESFAAGEDAEIVATWNGEPVPLNLIPVDADEDLDGFELFIKG